MTRVWIRPSEAKDKCPYYSKCPWDHECEPSLGPYLPNACMALFSLVRKGLVKVG